MATTNHFEISSQTPNRPEIWGSKSKRTQLSVLRFTVPQQTTPQCESTCGDESVALVWELKGLCIWET